MKKQFGLFMIICIIISGFTSCNKKTPPKEKIKLTAFIGEVYPAMNEEGTIVGDMITEMSGYEVEQEYLVGDLLTRAGVMLASGDYPDFINARNEHYRFRAAGAFIPLEDLILDHAPNLKKLIGDHWPLLFNKDGHIDTIPDFLPQGVRAPNRAEKGWWIQKAVLEDAGWPVVKTFEQFWDIIENYKAKHPTINKGPTIGFQPLTHDWFKWYLLEAFTELSGRADTMANVDRDEKGDWVTSPLYFTPEAKEYWKMMNTAYLKGLVNKEGFVSTLDQYKEMLTSGRVLGIYDEAWVFQEAQDYLKANDPERVFVAMPVTFDGGKDQYHKPPALTTSMGTSISVNCEDPVAAIKWLDFLAREEIQKLGYWGVEGRDYEVDDEGRFFRTPEQHELFSDRNNDYYYPQWGGLYYVEHWPSAVGTFSDGNSTNSGEQPEVFYDSLKEVDKEILDAYNVKNFTQFFTSPNNPDALQRVEYRPLYAFTPEAGSAPHLFQERWNEERAVYNVNLVLAPKGEFETLWKEYTDAYKKYNSQPYFDYLNESIKDKVSKSKRS